MIFVTNKNSATAFTFIELLIVIIIIGILTGVSWPQFKKAFNTLQLNSFSQTLQSAMNYLHNRSVVEGKIIYSYIDNEKKEYWAQEKDSPNRLKTYPLPPGITIETDKQEVFFYPDGQIDKVTIELINPDNQKVVLTTKGVFGGVKLSSRE